MNAVTLRKKRQHLFCKMGSPDNGFAVEAVRALEVRRGWLKDGSLKGAILWHANLTDAILRGTNLTDADLGDCNLEHAHLTDAILSGVNFTVPIWRAPISLDANLGNANLRHVHFLWGRQSEACHPGGRRSH